MRRKRRLLMGVTGLAVSSAGCYAALNLAFVNVVTLIHHVVLTVEVCDEATSSPIAAAHVSWAAKNGHGPVDALGVTDARGVFVVETWIQQQPPWMWPLIGTLDLNRWVLQVDAPGHAQWTADLGPLVRVPLSNAVATVRVRLRRA